jgi:plastocyanin
MVQLAQVIGAVALFSHSVLAAPAVRRQYQQQYDNSYPQNDNKYNGDNKYTQPSYDNKYTQPSDDNKYTPPSYDMSTPPSTYTTPMMDDKTPMMYETTSAPYETPTYGSGQSNWGNSYDDCVSQCVAKYGAPPMEWSPSEPMPPPKSTGAVHTIMVAPTQGVLRYWPFAVNATVGDTIRYVWTTPANHTATLSSALTICNKSAKADELNWVSGVRNASAGTQTFDVTIQTNEQQFFYCSVAQHCSKGMFGMVQPKMGGNNTVSSNMNKWLDSNPDLKAAWAVVHKQTQGPSADTWGDHLNVDSIPEDSHMDLAQNIIWSRAMFAANPGALEANSAATPDGSPLKIVGDLNTLLSATNQDPNQASVPAGTPTGSVPVPSAAASELAQSQGKTGAGFKTSAPVWVVAFVGVVSYLVL